MWEVRPLKQLCTTCKHSRTLLNKQTAGHFIIENRKKIVYIILTFQDVPAHTVVTHMDWNTVKLCLETGYKGAICKYLK